MEKEMFKDFENPLKDLVFYNTKIEDVDLKLLKDNNFVTDIDWSNMSSVLNLCSEIISSDKEDKLKLYLLGLILTKNKNEFIFNLRKEFATLCTKITRQRKYINKIISSNKKLKNKSKPKTQSEIIDEIAWKKANATYNQPVRKKIVVVKKKTYQQS